MIKQLPWALCAAVMAGTPAGAQTLAEAMVHTYELNPKLLAEREQLKATDERVPQAFANWRPTIQASAGYGATHDEIVEEGRTVPLPYPTQYPSRYYGFTLNQPIYRGGRTVAETRGAYAAVRAQTAHMTSVEQAVLLQAATDYLGVVLYTAAHDLAEKRVSDLDQQLASARARSKAGDATRTDVAQAEAAYAGALLERQQARIKAQSARLEFQRDIGLTPAALAYPAGAMGLPASEARAIELAVSENPDVLEAEANLEAAREAVTEAHGQSRPQVSILGTLQRQDTGGPFSRQENIASVVGQVKMPLYSGGALASQVREAEDKVSAYRLQVIQVRQKATADARIAWEQWASGQEAVDQAQKAAEANLTAAQGVRFAKAAGELTELDVLNAEHTAFQSRVELLRAQHDKLLAAYALLSSAGMLTASKLGLQTEIYDPAKHLNAVSHRLF